MPAQEELKLVKVRKMSDKKNIKPLVWDSGRWDCEYTAETPLGRFFIHWRQDGSKGTNIYWVMYLSFCDHDIENIGTDFRSITVAQSAAKEHYENLVMGLFK